MPNKTDYLQLSKPLLTEAADIAVLNTNFDLIDEEFNEINGRSRKRVTYIESSQNWTVPEGVSEIDVFLINGGYDGEDGEVAEENDSTGLAYAHGGNGGKGGGCLYYSGLKVTPEETFVVVVGASNGGISSFGLLSGDSVNGMSGGDGAGNTGKTDEDRKGKLPKINNLYNSRCPLDGGYYGISGGAGSPCCYGKIESEMFSAGGNAGKDNADHRPGGGEFYKTGMVSRNYCGGGGASYDEDGEGNPSRDIGGDGGNATTYGCGGGGGGGANQNGTAGLGGAGAPGAVIIAY